MSQSRKWWQLKLKLSSPQTVGREKKRCSWAEWRQRTGHQFAASGLRHRHSLSPAAPAFWSSLHLHLAFLSSSPPPTSHVNFEWSSHLPAGYWSGSSGRESRSNPCQQRMPGTGHRPPRFHPSASICRKEGDGRYPLGCSSQGHPPG